MVAAFDERDDLVPPAYLDALDAEANAAANDREVAERVPPHDLEAEAAVLSAVMVDETAFTKVSGFLKPSHFFSEAHARIFEAAVGLTASGKPIDVVTVASTLRTTDRLTQVGGVAYLTKLLNAAPSVGNVEAYGELVRAKWLARQTIFGAQLVAAQGYAGADTGPALASLAAIRAQTEPSKYHPAGPADLARAWKQEGQLVRVSTGFQSLDEACRGGLPLPWRTVIVGAPSGGKTALAMVLGHRFATIGELCVGVQGIDEEPEDLTVRVAQMCGFTVAQCEARDPETLEQMAEALGQVRIRFYDAKYTIEAAADDLAGWAASENRRAALIIDSLQTARCAASVDAKSLREMVDANVRAIRTKGTEHRLLVISTSEANRGSYRSDDAAETSNDMAAGKESGSIEFSAQTLIMVRTPKGHPDVVHVRVPKNRRGARAGFELFLRLDRDRHSLEECPNPANAPGVLEEREQKQRSANRRNLEKEAAQILTIIVRTPGIGTRGIRAEVKVAGLIIGRETQDALLLHLAETGRIENRPTQHGKREDSHYYPLSNGQRGDS